MPVLGSRPARLGVPLLDEYLRFLAGRCRPNTVLAAAYDLKVFFTVVGKQPHDVQPADVLAFVTAQRTGQRVDRRRAACRWSDDAGRCVVAHGATPVVERVRAVRVPACPWRRCDQPGAAWVADPAGATATAVRGCRWCVRVRTLPRILTPAEVDALMAALRTHRDRAMVAAMVLGGLRRCEVLGLRLDDLRVAERRVFIAEGKGGHQRLIPVSRRFFDHVAAYLDAERPAGARHRLRVRGVEGTATAGNRCPSRDRPRSSTALVAAPGSRTRPVTSCGTPA